MQKRRFSPNFADTEEPLINLTPLIDVVFVVLITFMLIAPVLDIDSVDLAQSSGIEKKELETSPITIGLHKDNTIWFQGSQITIKALESALRTEKKRHPKAIPQLAPDTQASFGSYQELKNMIEAIGFEQMDIILRPAG